MKKCTLCVDRITDASLPERERKPACVLACPTSARIFGVIHDPQSVVAKAIRENGGYALMPEWGTHPQPLPAAAQDRDPHPPRRAHARGQPVKVDGLLPKPAATSRRSTT